MCSIDKMNKSKKRKISEIDTNVKVVFKRKHYNKTCEFDGCNKQPKFNISGEKHPRFCVEHKEIGMIDIKTKTCEFNGCTKIPNFNIQGQKQPKFCCEHKENNMINIMKKTCEFIGCTKIPLFNISDQKQGKFCVVHKENNMINVIHTTCINCNTIANFGYCGQQSSHCAKHKLEFMINKPKSKCIIENCKELAIFGEIYPQHCEEHQQNNEFCWLVQHCIKCNRQHQLLDKHDLCHSFCSLEKLDIQQKLYEKVKETIMINFIQNKIKLSNHVKISSQDKIINSNCNLYRPDLSIDCGTHIVVIECDEHQHRNYNWSSCTLNRSLKQAEEKRMYEIMQAFGGLPTIFLRWNPDNFNTNNKINKSYSQTKRLEILKKWIEHCINLKLEDIQHIVQYKQLFYDNYEETNINFQVIDEESIL